MTDSEREICKIYLEDLAYLNKSHSCNEYKLLMKMLDAEPCEDTISRQAAIDEINGWIEATKDNCHYESSSDLRLVKRGIENLPSVTPKQKTGHWIFVHPLQADDIGGYMCSECECGDFDIKSSYKFCPYCGAKMKVDEE